MKRQRLAALWITAVLLWSPSAIAQREPLLIASIRSLDELFADMNYLAEGAGAGQLGQILTMTTRQYAQGLDGSRPVTIYVDASPNSTDANGFRWLVFLPTQNLQTFLSAASSQMGTPRQLEGGIYQTTGVRSFFLKQQGPWTVLADSIQALQTPTMPLEQILRAVDKESDLSVRGFVANMPAHLRAKTLQQIADKSRAELATIEAGSPAAQVKALLTREKWDQVSRLLQDLDQFSIGWNTNQQARKVTASINVTARPDSLTYRRLGQFQLRRSSFAGMLASNAFASWNAIGQLPAEDATRFEQLFRSLQTAAIQELSSSSQFSDESTRQLTLRLADAMFETCGKSLREGFFDGAGMMFFSGSELSAVTGMRVADTSALSDAAATLASRSSAAGIAWQAQMNVAEHQGVALHRFSFETPNDESLRRAVGPRIEITMGMGPEEAYLAWGKQGVTLIQQAVDRVRQGTAEPVLPFHSRVMLTPLLRLWAQSSADAKIARVAESLAASQGRDSAVLRATPIRDGVRFDIELEESVLKTAGYYALLSMRRSKRSAKTNRTQAPTPVGR